MKKQIIKLSKTLILSLILIIGTFGLLTNETIHAYYSENDVTDANETLKNAQEALTKAQKTLNEAQEALNEIENNIKKQNEQRNENGNEIKKLNEEKEALTKEQNAANTTEERKAEINTRLEAIETNIQSLNGETTEIATEITNLESQKPVAKQNIYNAQENVNQAEQAVKEAEADLKEIKAELCTDNSTECTQAQIEADKAAQEAEQQEYDEAIVKYNNCVQECENNTNWLQDPNGRSFINNCLENCDEFKEDTKDFENRQSQILSAEQALYKTQTLKELTFDVESILNIDPMIVDTQEYTAQEKPYFNDTENSPIFSFILRAIDFAIKIMGSIAVLIIIIAGFILVISTGNDSRIEQGKNAIKYAIIGLVLAFMSYTIVLFVQAIFTN
jgi:myosin heavy subunit